MPKTLSQPAAPSPDDAIRHHTRCDLCSARPGDWCRHLPTRGLHLARWLDAETAGVISRAELVEVVVGLVVITKRVIVDVDRERAA